MKNISLGLMAAVLGIIGMHNHAFAQMAPMNSHVSVGIQSHTVSSPTVVPTIPVAHVSNIATPDPILAPANHTPNHVADINSGITIPTFSNPAAVMNPGLAAIGSPSSPFPHITIATLPSNSNAIAHVGLAAIVGSQTASSNSGIPNPDPSNGSSSGPSSGSSGGGASGSSGGGYISGGTTTGYMYPSYTTVNPVVYISQPAPAYVAPTSGVHTEAKTVIRKQIPMIPVDTTPVVSTNQNQNDYAASTYNLGTHITLVEVLAAIAGLLMIVVAAKEYQMRKRMVQVENQPHVVYA
jgi:hypothetical protein